MRPQRIVILTTLAGLTLMFLGAAAYAYWGDAPVAFSQKPSPTNFDRGAYPKKDRPHALRLTIQQTGIQVVTLADVKAHNLRIDGFSPASLRLTYAGQPVPFHVQQEGETAALYFFARAVTDTLQAPAVYWLSEGEGAAMEERGARPDGSGDPHGQQRYRWEENDTFLANTNGGDVWLGPLIMAPRQWELAMEGLRSNGGPAQLKIRVWSSTQDTPNPDHHLQIAVNGRSLQSWYWDGIKQETITLNLEPGILQEGRNTLTLRAPGDTGAAGEALYIDWVTLEYEGVNAVAPQPVWFRSDAPTVRASAAGAPPLIFDVTDKQNPVYLSGVELVDNRVDFAGQGVGHEYYLVAPGQAHRPEIESAPSWKESLRGAERGADYIAIVADVDGFQEALTPLLTYRAAQGLRVTAVSLNQVFDEFGHGHRTPEAIRAFLDYAAANWQEPAPRFVLLVGDATFEMHRQSGAERRQWLPTYFYYTPHDGYIATDAWFVQGDETPAAVGRFPAQSAAQLEAMAAKTMAYEQHPQADRWAQQALLVADDEPQFGVMSDYLAANLHLGGYQVRKLYMTVNENIYFDLMSALNQGVGVVNYLGHGREDVWGDEAVFQAKDAQLLTNEDRLPIFTTFTCRNGAFAQPGVDSLAETLLWAADGGIVAAVAPSGSAGRNQQITFADHFYEALLTHEVETLGEAMVYMKRNLGEKAGEGELYSMLNLLGDPALRIHRP